MNGNNSGIAGWDQAVLLVDAEINDELRERGVEFEVMSYPGVEAAEICGVRKVAMRLLSEIKGKLK